MQTPHKPKAPTRRDRNFHHQRAAFLENSLKRHLSDGRLTEDDANLIREFLDEVIANNDISVSRANKLGYHLIGWRRFIGPFRENTIGDLRNGLRQLKEAPRTRWLFDREMLPGEHEPKPLTKNTIYDFVTILKRFYRWLIENQHSAIDLKKINSIKSPGKDRMTKTVDMIVTADEAKAIIDVCESPRDRALFAMLWDGGFRIVEVGTLTWAQVKFDRFGCAVKTSMRKRTSPDTSVSPAQAGIWPYGATATRVPSLGTPSSS